MRPAVKIGESPLRSHPSNLVAYPLCALALALSGCGQKPAMPPRTITVGVVTLQAEPVTVTTTLTGRTTATMVAEVRPQVDGVIRERLFQEGALVHAGQPLYQIDARLYRASLDTARAQLESARASLFSAEAKQRRYASLGEAAAVSAQDRDETTAAAMTARAAVHQYQASVQTASVNLEYTRVLAPITGRIGRSAFTRGALVTAAQSTALATIQQLDPIYVDITQSAADILRLRQALSQGQMRAGPAQVRLRLEDGTTYPLPGTVEFSEVNVDPQAGTVTIRARFPNPQGLLMPGMFVSVDAPQGVVQQGLLAPQQGISRDARGQASALVVDGGGTVQQRMVVTGQAVGNRWLITSGLRPGDRLIVEGTDKAQPGAHVTAVDVKAGS